MSPYNDPNEITLRSQIRYLRVVKIIPGCWVLSFNAGMTLMAFFNLIILCCSVAVLTGSYARGWGFWVRFGEYPLYAGASGLPVYAPVTFAVWFGYAWYCDSYLEDHAFSAGIRLNWAIGGAPQAWGIIITILLCVTTATSVCYGMSALTFLRGWYEVGVASGGNKAAIPSVILGMLTISGAGAFYGSALQGVQRYWANPPPLLKLTGVIDGGINIKPDWAFYICVIISAIFFMMAYLAFVLPTQDDLMEWLKKVENPNPPQLATPLGKVPERLTKSIKIPAVLKPEAGEAPALVDEEKGGIQRAAAPTSW